MCRHLARSLAGVTLAMLMIAPPCVAQAPSSGVPPPTIAPGLDLESWLADHPRIVTALQWQQANGSVLPYPAWPAAMRAQLAELVARIGAGAAPDLPEAPPLVRPADPGAPFPPLNPELARWAPEVARATYLAYAAQSLAVEIGHWVAWSIDRDGSEVLAQLFDSRSLWRAEPSSGTYRIPYDFGAATPGDPYRQFEFLRTHDLIGATSRQTIERLLDWTGRNVVHFQGDWDAANVYANWQYYGWPPVERIIAGTTNDSQPSAGVQHRAGACFGTVGFLRLVLRTANIPVELLHPCPGHGVPHFVREDLYLSHGDDPYDLLMIAQPPIPAGALLIDRGRYDAWLSGDEVSITRCKNIGRQVRELALQHLPNQLLAMRCADRAAGTAEDHSQVYAVFKFNYSVGQLEQQRLWKRLDEKITALGGCASIPPARW